MSEAVATRKRKLYKVLDALSAPPRPASVAGHPSPLTPSPRLDGAASVTMTSAAEEARQRRVSSLTRMADYRARLGKGAADKRISMASSNGSTTVLKPTNTILHHTGSSGSLRTKQRASLSSKQSDSSLKKSTSPAFCPWSHDGFLDRLRTFAPVTNWLTKPSKEVSEVQWAKRGWSCIGIETVACGACKSRQIIDFSPPDQGRESKRRRVAFQDGDAGDENDNDLDESNDYDYEEAFEKGLIERYAAVIVEGHSLTCPWRKIACKDEIYHMPVVQREWWQRHITDSYKAAISMAEDITKLNIRPVEATPSVEAVLASLPRSFLHGEDISADPPKDLQARALTIALTGWTPTIESSNNLLSCSACFQRIGLWLYQTAPATKLQQSSADDEDDTEDGNTAVLDLITQHREHCPFRNPASQASTGAFADQPAWWILWQTLARWANESKRRSLASTDVTSFTETTFAPVTSTFTTDITGGLSKEEVSKLDKERSSKLLRLRKVLGIFKTGKKETLQKA